MSTMQRAIALPPTPDNLLDHLGVLAAILDIPLIVSEQKTYDLAAYLYPQIKTVFMEASELSLDYMATHFDILFVSSKLWAVELYPVFPLLYNKNMRVIYVPHGNSDKGYTLTKESHNPEDVSLVYGDHMLDLLKDTGMFDKINHTIRTGNYRYQFFREHRTFYQKLAYDKVFAKLDSTKKTIFYAPTWKSEEHLSSFFTDCNALIEQLTDSFNFLIKLHPYLYEQLPAETISTIERYKDHPQVLFLEDFPPIYPLLELADAYLGDFSSIGYDFLVFDKPMYFFNPSGVDVHKDRGCFLHRCGMEISTKKEGNVFDFIEATLEHNQSHFSPMRSQVYDYAFGQEVPLAELRRAITALCKDESAHLTSGSKLNRAPG